jgi:hypothetical protein
MIRTRATERGRMLAWSDLGRLACTPVRHPQHDVAPKPASYGVKAKPLVFGPPGRDWRLCCVSRRVTGNRTDRDAFAVY